ncbi:MAG: hypothetical protein IJU48_09815 [Synergistaceae bacterium]|nr:hypothetical protein [Synergistaceae bacterium]
MTTRLFYGWIFDSSNENISKATRFYVHIGEIISQWSFDSNDENIPKAT